MMLLYCGYCDRLLLSHAIAQVDIVGELGARTVTGSSFRGRACVIAEAKHVGNSPEIALYVWR